MSEWLSIPRRLTFCDAEYPMISGSCDGIAHGFSEYPDEQILLEFKTSNTKSFKALREKGIKEEKYQHYVQINLYLLWSGLKRALYIVTCKETDELYAEWVEFDADVANAELAKAKEILLSQKLPARCETAKAKRVCHVDSVITKAFVGRRIYRW